MKDESIGIGLLIAALLLGALVVGNMTDVSAYFKNNQITGNHTLCTWNCSLWQQTTQADFQTGIAVNVSTTANPGSVILDNRTTWPSIYATAGASTTFLLYNISNNTWVTRASTTNNFGAGGGVSYIGLGNISGLRGAGFTTFWIYNITTNTWTAKAVTPATVNTGSTLLDYRGSGNISALRGLNTATFWQYNITSNSWSAFAAAPGNVGAGGTLVYDNGNYIYAFNGTATRNFWRYSISGNSWSAMTNAPGNVGAGGALTYDNGNYIYAFNGTATRNFWRYSISGNSWSPMTNIPGNVGAGGSLAYDNGNYIYAFNGTTNNFWRYDISGNSWSSMANALATIGAGGSLTYVPNSSVYTNAGNLSSVVNNSGHAGASWYNIIWSGTTNPGVTNITFKVRASDSFFLPGDALPSWVSIGWPSPVTTGLPSGRYFQWQAILTTKDPTQSPTLNDVSLCYT